MKRDLICLGGVSIEVTRKDIKHVHLSVHRKRRHIPTFSSDLLVGMMPTHEQATI